MRVEEALGVDGLDSNWPFSRTSKASGVTGRVDGGRFFGRGVPGVMVVFVAVVVEESGRD